MDKRNTTAPTFAELQDLKDAGKARVLDTALEGTCQLVQVEGQDNVVVLSDNTTIWAAEDAESGDPIF